MRRFETLPVDRLVSDVTVDPLHVRELADSIKVSGPITPVLVREENLSLIDGFHRVAAMRELGFNEIECIVLDCNEETFWDMRITAASTHKAVTFARVVDWIDEVFQISPGMERYSGSYKSAFSLFNSVDRDTAPEDVKRWATNKAQQWGLAVSTIRQWLYTKQSLSPELLAEAKSQGSTVEPRELPFTHYYRVAETLPGEPSLQRQVIQKAKEESLTGQQTREVAKAVKQAPNEEAANAVLSQRLDRPVAVPTESHRPLGLPEDAIPVQLKNKVVWNLSHYGVKADFYTIGYAGRDIDQFIEILKAASISTIVDVRNAPVSQYKPDFSRENLKDHLERSGFQYVHRGDLGVPHEIRARAL